MTLLQYTICVGISHKCIWENFLFTDTFKNDYFFFFFFFFLGLGYNEVEVLSWGYVIKDPKFLSNVD